MKSAVVKRSIVLSGHKTSVSLEDDFWQSLREIATERGPAWSPASIATDTSPICRRPFGYTFSLFTEVNSSGKTQASSSVKVLFRAPGRRQTNDCAAAHRELLTQLMPEGCQCKVRIRIEPLIIG
jgi:hypothetical protein